MSFLVTSVRRVRAIFGLADGQARPEDAPAPADELSAARPVEPVTFGRDGSACALSTHGIDHDEDGFSWTIGRQSSVSLPVAAHAWPGWITIDLEPIVIDGLRTTQALTIQIDGAQAWAIQLTERVAVRVPVPSRAAATGGAMQVCLTHPGFIDVSMLGDSTDVRPRAIAVFGITLGSLPAAHSVAPVPAIARDAGSAHGGVNPAAVPESRFGPADIVRDLDQAGFHVTDEGAVWTGQPHASFSVPRPSGAARLSLDLVPLCIVDLRPSQRLTVIVDARVVGQFVLSAATVIEVDLPAPGPGDRPRVPVVLVCPDCLDLSRFDYEAGVSIGVCLRSVAIKPDAAVRPLRCDPRDEQLGPVAPLAVSDGYVGLSHAELSDRVQERFGLDTKALLRNFESLGDSCTFGLAQRKEGVEVLGLLRFANTPLASLMEALDDGFVAANDPAQIEVGFEHGFNEYLVWIKEYGIRWHTSVFKGQAEPDTVLSDNIVKLSYLRRKFYEGVRRGRKIYVVSRATSRKTRRIVPFAVGAPYREAPLKPMELAEIVPLWNALNRDSENTLLYILPADAEHPPGKVDRLGPRLLRGYVSEPAIRAEVALPDWDHTEWLNVAAAAWGLREEQAQADATV